MEEAPKPNKAAISAAAAAMGRKGAKNRWADPDQRKAQGEVMKRVRAKIGKKKMAKILSDAGKKGAEVTNKILAEKAKEEKK